MGITSSLSKDEIRKRSDEFLELIQAQQIKRLQMLGEMCVSHARNIPKTEGFGDQTGNLRSSIGYVVFVDGIAVHSMFEQRKEGAEGVKAGEALAQKIGQKNSQGICLVVTAGMNYALYLESKGRDVITSAEHLAQRELPKMLDKLLKNIKSAAE